MQLWHRVFTLGLAAAVCVLGQTAPPIDNEQARVVVAHDRPHNKGQLHEHKLNRVMIYLQAGKQDIITKDGKKTTLTWKAGDVKWSPASGPHTSEVISDDPVTIVEIEVKKPGDPSKTITTPLDPVKVDSKDYKVEFENSQVRVTRVKFAAKKGAPMHEHQLNRVVVYLTDQNTQLTSPDGKVDTTAHKAGEFSWGGPTKHKEDNLMSKPFEGLMIEFKN
jgi:uncharacterized RmlC-like cupin family protein